MAKMDFDNMFAAQRKEEDAAKEQGTAKAVASTIGKVVGDPFADDTPAVPAKKEIKKTEKAAPKKETAKNETKPAAKPKAKPEKKKETGNKVGRPANKFRVNEPGANRGIWLSDKAMIALKNEANSKMTQVNVLLEEILRERYKIK